MLLIAASCAARLGIWLGRAAATTEIDADGLHVLMGVAMAGMLEPRLGPRSRRSPGGPCSPPPQPGSAGRPSAPADAATAQLAMRAPRTARSRVRSHGLHAPAGHVRRPPRRDGNARHERARGRGQNPAIALVLALFMLGYILWTTDQLATLSRAGAVVAASVGPPSPGVSAPAPLGPAARVVSKVGAQRADSPAIAALAPRFAAGYKIAMSVAMGYMLITMI